MIPLIWKRGGINLKDAESPFLVQYVKTTIGLSWNLFRKFQMWREKSPRRAFYKAARVQFLFKF